MRGGYFLILSALVLLGASGCYPNPDDLRTGGGSGSGIGGCLGAGCTATGQGGTLGGAVGGSTGAGGGTAPTGDTTAYAAALCDRYQACAPYNLTVTFGTTASCQARYKIAQDTFLLLPDTGWTAAAITACAAAQRAQSCADFN